MHCVIRWMRCQMKSVRGNTFPNTGLEIVGIEVHVGNKKNKRFNKTCANTNGLRKKCNRRGFRDAGKYFEWIEMNVHSCEAE